MNYQGLAIGDGLCDPETMLNYGEVLLNIGLIDQLDNDGFKAMEKLTLTLIKQKKWTEAFKVPIQLFIYVLIKAKNYLIKRGILK